MRTGNGSVKRKWVKRILIVFGIIVLFVVLVIIFISPITKYLIEKYDEKYTGRQITIGWLVLNPFTGYIHMSNFKLYELKSDSVFFSAGGITVDVSVWKMLSGTYKVESFTLTDPVAKVIKDGDRFNFTDLLEKFASKKDSLKPPKKKSEPMKYILGDVKIKNGTFYYIEKGTPINYFIKKTDFSTPGTSWNVDTIAGKYYLEPGVGSGSIQGTFSFNLKTTAYAFAVLIKKFDLGVFEQYLKELSNYGSFRANMDADLKGKGDLHDKLNIDATGYFAINDFHFGKEPKDDYVSFAKLAVGINKLNPKNKQYIFDSIMLYKPFFRYEKYDTLDNVSRMFGKGGSNIKKVQQDPQKVNLILELAKYMEALAKNFLHSYYKIDKFAMVDADMKFNDYSLREKFSVSMDPFNILADSVDKGLKRVDIDIWSGIKPYGNFKFTISLDPQDNSNFDLHYKMANLASSMFNPYLVTYTSFPLDRGSIEFYGSASVRKGNINSINHFVLIDPRTGGRVRKKDASWIPMPLIMAFVRERGNVIDYEIPITGDLNNPKFSISDILTDLLKNIFVKPATTPYRMEIKNVEQEVEKSLRINWPARQVKLEEKQEKFLEKIVNFVKDDERVHLDVHPVMYEEREKEQILFWLAKKKFCYAAGRVHGKTLSEEDSTMVDKLSVKDPEFLAYLRNQVKDSMLFTVQQRCRRIISEDQVNNYYTEMIKQRKAVFIDYFEKEGVAARVKIGSYREEIPYNGFSFFDIKYEGDFPDEVKKAYDKLNEYNQEKPRKKFEKGHKSTLQKIFGGK